MAPPVVATAEALANRRAGRVNEPGGQFLRVPVAEAVVLRERDETAPSRAEAVLGASAVAETFKFARGERNEPFQR